MKVYTLQTSAETINDFFSEGHYLAEIDIDESDNSFTITRGNGSQITFKAVAPNQRIKVGDTDFGLNDEIELIGGNNVTLAADASNKTITINSNPPVHNQTIATANATFSADATITLTAGANISVTASGTNGIAISTASMRAYSASVSGTTLYLS